MQEMIHRTALGLMLCGAAAFAQTPELIRGLSAMNAASLAGEGLPDAGVAPGARFALFGRSLDSAPVETITARVAIDGSSAPVKVLSTSAKRLDLLLPLYASLGSGTVTVEVNGIALTAPIRVVERAFGIYSEPVPGANGRRLRGTGLGRDDSPAGIEVLVAGQPVPAMSVTRLPDGFDDIDFEVPPGAASCATPVAVRANGRVSNTAIFATSADCPASPVLDDRGQASVTLTRSQSIFENFRRTSDAGTGSFYRGSGPAGAVNNFTPFQAGSCVLQYFIEQDPAEYRLQPLDAGPKLDIQGPKGTRDLQRQSKGQYSRELGQQMEVSIPGLPPQPSGLFLDQGEYTITGSGGADVGPFTARISVPAPATWINPSAAASIDRARDLRIEWRDATAGQLVNFSGISVAGSRPLVAAAFTCIERGDRGSLTVPAHILSALPASAPDGAQVLLTVTPGRAVEFSAAGLDQPGVLSYSQDITSQAKFQ